ncbi:hypothetical protein GLW08_10150 [Pontibacillus yanchengensis]|uniref:Uncharacterized protein n=1 Tax=Pontibacillus yanchengensis TaxID=462910 RepID=A0ACC7VFF1_9BACI|nr:hypothetical protein [Pontibacillus yanchengensis]MYL53696.1 hypothetical protein [Pontibacillus yanchengensis]
MEKKKRDFLKEHLAAISFFLLIALFDQIIKVGWIETKYVLIFSAGYTVVMLFDYYRRYSDSESNK